MYGEAYSPYTSAHLLFKYENNKYLASNDEANSIRARISAIVLLYNIGGRSTNSRYYTILIFTNSNCQFNI